MCRCGFIFKIDYDLKKISTWLWFFFWRFRFGWWVEIDQFLLMDTEDLWVTECRCAVTPVWQYRVGFYSISSGETQSVWNVSVCQAFHMNSIRFYMTEWTPTCFPWVGPTYWVNPSVQNGCYFLPCDCDRLSLWFNCDGVNSMNSDSPF